MLQILLLLWHDLHYPHQSYFRRTELAEAAVELARAGGAAAAERAAVDCFRMLADGS